MSGGASSRVSMRNSFRDLAIDLNLRSKALESVSAREASKLTLLSIPVPPKRVKFLTRALHRYMYPELRRLCAPIPRNTILGMRENYSEKLPKTMRLKTASLESRQSRAFRAAEYLGIIDLLQSDAVRVFAEHASGTRLVRDPGCQVICYEPGDFSGPHNDHHPEEDHLKRGYVDLHIMLAEVGVASQLLIYEKSAGLLNAVEEVGQGVGVAVYRLPFWHYTTPLIPRRPRDPARRWLLLSSFEIAARR